MAAGWKGYPFSEAKDTSEQPGQLLNKELKMTAPNFFNLSQTSQNLKLSYLCRSIRKHE